MSLFYIFLKKSKDYQFFQLAIVALFLKSLIGSHNPLKKGILLLKFISFDSAIFELSKIAESKEINFSPKNTEDEIVRLENESLLYRSSINTIKNDIKSIESSVSIKIVKYTSLKDYDYQ